MDAGGIWFQYKFYENSISKFESDISPKMTEKIVKKNFKSVYKKKFLFFY